MIKKFKLALAGSALLVGSVAGFAFAKGHGHGRGPGKQALVQKFDANGDGQLDDAEKLEMKDSFRALRAQRKADRLAKFDANKDGSLDAAEKLAIKETRAAARFKALDLDGDGKLTLDEFKLGAKHGPHGRMRKHP